MVEIYFLVLALLLKEKNRKSLRLPIGSNKMRLPVPNLKIEKQKQKTIYNSLWCFFLGPKKHNNFNCNQNYLPSIVEHETEWYNAKSLHVRLFFFSGTKNNFKKILK